MVDPFEAKIASFFRSKGYYTVVSSGSRGVADIVTLRANEVLLIQCKKRGRISPIEREALRSTADRLHATPVIVQKRRRRIAIETLSLKGLVGESPSIQQLDSLSPVMS